MLNPQITQIEQAVLMSFLGADDDVRDYIQLHLRARQIPSPLGRSLYNICLSLMQQGKALDKLSLIVSLNEHGAEKEAKYLAECPPHTCNMSSIPNYIEALQRYSKRQAIIDIGVSLQRLAREPNANANEVLGKAQDALFDVQTDTAGSTFKRVDKILPNVLSNIEKMRANGRKLPGISTGFRDYDNMTGGLHNGELTLLAARPSMGKTTLGLNIAYNVANAGIPVLIFSLEMPADQLTKKLLSSISGESLRSVMWGDFLATEEKKERLLTASNKLCILDLFIDDTSTMDTATMYAKATKLSRDLVKKSKRLGLIVVDYIQIIKAERSFSRNDEVTKISAALKGLARTLNLPVIALSQLSRVTESRPDKKPALGDLRDSGSLEQDADVVALLFRESYYKRNDPDLENEATLFIEKNRNGRTGQMKLTCSLVFSTFNNSEQEIPIKE